MKSSLKDYLSFIHYKTVTGKVHSKKKAIFFDLSDPLIFRRYLYLFIKFLHLSGYHVYFRDDFKLYRKLKSGIDYLYLLIEENIVLFSSTSDIKFAIEYNDQNLSPDYFSFMLSGRHSPNNFYVPMTMHPLMYHNEIWNDIIKTPSRKNSIFMIGNFDDKAYREIESTPFDIISRIEIYNFLLKKKILTSYNTLNDFLKFIDSSLDYKCILLSTNNFIIPMKDLRNTISKFSFFLACPGVTMPYSHNLIEAMSVGAIPLIQSQYAEMFHPSLKHLNNAIVFYDLEDLEKKIDLIYNISNELLQKMTENVLKYYNNHLTPAAVINSLEKHSSDKIYLQAEHASVEIFINMFYKKDKLNKPLTT